MVMAGAGDAMPTGTPASPYPPRQESWKEVIDMSLDFDDLPIEILGLDIDELEIESLTTGLGTSEATPVSCCSVPCSCCCCSSTCCSA